MKMVMTTSAIYLSISTGRYVKAIKNHSCQGCTNKIQPSDIYVSAYVRSRNTGRFPVTVAYCETCMEEFKRQQVIRLRPRNYNV